MSKAHKLIARQVEVFRARKADDSAGEKSKVAADCIRSGEFENIALTPLSGKHVAINRQQFYQALCDALNDGRE